MSVRHVAVQWTPLKRRTDALLLGALAAGLAAWASISVARDPQLTAETLILRGTALAAFALLHVILAIGPLARLDARFLPLLYNRRHLGVAMALLALVHGSFATIQFHALGDRPALVSMLSASRLAVGSSLAGAPFEPFGALALVVLVLMAATSHDFWLKNLGAFTWKALHLAVFVAYGAIVAHVALGALQSERSPLLAALVIFPMAGLLGLHVAAARREARVDAAPALASERAGFDDVGALADLALVEGRGRVVVVGGRRLALYLAEGRLHAMSNACRHQGGPLGEGRIVDGCVTCPWHGWQYRAQDGCSPPPFREVVETHRVVVRDGRVLIERAPLPEATRSEGAPVTARAGEAA